MQFYLERVSEFAENVVSSEREELEIIALKDMYLEKDILERELLGCGYTWLDTGTMDSLVK